MYSGSSEESDHQPSIHLPERAFEKGTHASPHAMQLLAKGF